MASEIISDKGLDRLREHLRSVFDLATSAPEKKILITLSRRSVPGVDQLVTMTGMCLDVVADCFLDFPMLPADLCPHTIQGYASPEAKSKWVDPLEKLLGNEFRKDMSMLLNRCVLASYWSAARLVRVFPWASELPRVQHPCNWRRNVEETFVVLRAAVGENESFPNEDDFRLAVHAAWKKTGVLRWHRMPPEQRAEICRARKEMWKNMPPEQQQKLSSIRMSFMKRVWKSRTPADVDLIRRAQCFRWTSQRRMDFLAFTRIL